MTYRPRVDSTAQLADTRGAHSSARVWAMRWNGTTSRSTARSPRFSPDLLSRRRPGGARGHVRDLRDLVRRPAGGRRDRRPALGPPRPAAGAEPHDRDDERSRQPRSVCCRPGRRSASWHRCRCCSCASRRGSPPAVRSPVRWRSWSSRRQTVGAAGTGVGTWPASPRDWRAATASPHCSPQPCPPKRSLSWGWRVAFLVAAPLGLVARYIRQPAGRDPDVRGGRRLRRRRASSPTCSGRGARGSVVGSCSWPPSHSRSTSGSCSCPATWPRPALVALGQALGARRPRADRHGGDGAGHGTALRPRRAASGADRGSARRRGIRRSGFWLARRSVSACSCRRS